MPWLAEIVGEPAVDEDGYCRCLVRFKGYLGVQVLYGPEEALEMALMSDLERAAYASMLGLPGLPGKLASGGLRGRT